MEKIVPWFIGAVAVIVLGLFVFVIVGVGFSACNQIADQQLTAEENAKTYADKMMEDHGPISCMNRDTDGDGYVSCVVQNKNGQNDPLECVGTQYGHFVKNKGCRIPMLKYTQ